LPTSFEIDEGFLDCVEELGYGDFGHGFRTSISCARDRGKPTNAEPVARHESDRWKDRHFSSGVIAP
jgi:hypothetical protein